MAEQQKVSVEKSMSRPGSFRAIIHVNDEISIGAIMSRTALRKLYYQVKDLLDESAASAPLDDELVVLEDDEGLIDG